MCYAIYSVNVHIITYCTLYLAFFYTILSILVSVELTFSSTAKAGFCWSMELASR